MTPLTTLQLIDSLRAGGAERMAVNMANALAERGVNSFLVATREEGILKDKISPKVHYRFLKKKRTLDPVAIRSLARLVKANKIQIIHAHTNSFFYAVLMKIRFPRLKIIWHNHTGKNAQLKGSKLLILKISSLFFDAIIHIDRSNLNWGQRHLFTKRQVKMTNFARLNKGRETYLKAKTYNIVHLAGFRREKDHLNLLEAFRRLLKHCPGAGLHLIGKDYGDDYSRQIKDFVREHRLGDSVFFYGERPDVGHILSQADMGVLSSESEGLPVALLEYGLAGLPVVATNVGGMGEVIEHGKNGLLVPPKNPGALAEAMLKWCQNPSHVQKAGRLLRQKVEAEYSEAAYMKRLLKIYGELLQ